MLEVFLRYINEKQLFSYDDKLLLAVSGGVDSVALIHLCKEAQLNVGIAHCNFQLRGEESEQDAVFVRALAEKYAVELYEQRFDTKAFAQNNGLSTQMAARRLRYEWFEQIRQQHGYDWLLTAHHQDDLLETVLLNLTRGTGLAGLHGILHRNGTTIRPLLFATRPQIHQYALNQGLQWREDSSNASTDYLRNRLRHEVVPTLHDINPQVSSAVAELAERVVAAEQILKESREALESTITERHGDTLRIDYEKLSQYTFPEERLAQWIADFGFGYTDAQKIWRHRGALVGKQFLSPTHVLTKDRGGYVVTPRHRQKEVYSIDEPSGQIRLLSDTLEWEEATEADFNAPSHQTYVDAEALRWPLTLRTWQEGDWFCPLGMKGKRQKLSDFLINAKVSRALKERVYVLESDQKIVWVVGFRLDERFKIEKNTKKIIKFYIY